MECIYGISGNFCPWWSEKHGCEKCKHPNKYHELLKEVGVEEIIFKQTYDY